MKLPAYKNAERM